MDSCALSGTSSPGTKPGSYHILLRAAMRCPVLSLSTTVHSYGMLSYELGTLGLTGSYELGELGTVVLTGPYELGLTGPYELGTVVLTGSHELGNPVLTGSYELGTLWMCSIPKRPRPTT